MRFRDRFDRDKRTPSTRNQRIGLAGFWLVVVSYAYFISSTPNFNTESHLYPAFSVVDHHTFNIDLYATRLGDKSYWKGHFYTDKAPGLSFLAVPLYAALRAGFPGHVAKGYTGVGRVNYSIPKQTVYLRYAITYFLLILPSGIFAMLFWRFLTKFVRSRVALVVALVYSLGTPAFPYSAWYFSHQLSAIMLFSAFLLLFRYVRGGEFGTKSDRCVVLAGVLAGYAVISEYPTALIAVAVCAYGIAVSRFRWRTAILFTVGATPPVIMNVAYDAAIYGKPFATGYTYVRSSLYSSRARSGSFGLPDLTSYGVQAPSINSLWQITFGTYRGLFVVSPVLLLFFAGVWAMWKRRDLRPEWLLCVTVVGTYFLLDAARPENMNGWSGGWSIASRHLTPMLPFMVFPIVFVIGYRGWHRIFLALGAVSVTLMFAIMATGNSGGFAYGDQNPLVNEVWRQLRRGHIGVNWGYLAGQMGVPSLIPLALLVGLFGTRIVWLYRSPAAPVAVRERQLAAADAS